jgi:hypothetical protein
MDVIGGTENAAFSATFVTFLDNAAGDGADLYLSADELDDLPISLRGVLFGGVGAGFQLSCGGGRFGTTVSGLTRMASLATDMSCGGPEDSVIARPSYGTVPFITGATDLPVPEGRWAGRDAVICGEGWPEMDQRAVERPQGEEQTCDAGAVERLAEDERHDGDEGGDEEEDYDPETDPDSVPPPGHNLPAKTPTEPIPTSIPAGGGGCVSGC